MMEVAGDEKIAKCIIYINGIENEEPPLFMCKVCRKKNRSREDLFQHIKYMHDIEEIRTAGEPNQEDTRNKEPKQIVQTHPATVALINCDECNLTFSSNSNLKSHNSTYHPFPCNYCNYRFMDSNKLGEHIKTSHKSKTTKITQHHTHSQ